MEKLPGMSILTDAQKQEFARAAEKNKQIRNDNPEIFEELKQKREARHGDENIKPVLPVKRTESVPKSSLPKKIENQIAQNEVQKENNEALDVERMAEKDKTSTELIAFYNAGNRENNLLKNDLPDLDAEMYQACKRLEQHLRWMPGTHPLDSVEEIDQERQKISEDALKFYDSVEVELNEILEKKCENLQQKLDNYLGDFEQFFADDLHFDSSIQPWRIDFDNVPHSKAQVKLEEMKTVLTSLKNEIGGLRNEYMQKVDEFNKKLLMLRNDYDKTYIKTENNEVDKDAQSEKVSPDGLSKKMTGWLGG